MQICKQGLSIHSFINCSLLTNDQISRHIIAKIFDQFLVQTSEVKRFSFKFSRSSRLQKQAPLRSAINFHLVKIYNKKLIELNNNLPLMF